LFAVLPPGAFVGMGLLIALKNIIDNRAKERTVELQLDMESGLDRVQN